MNSHECSECHKTFTRKNHRDRHEQEVHADKIKRCFVCLFCNLSFNTMKKMHKHRKEHKPITNFQLLNTGLKRTCRVFRKTYGDEKIETVERAFFLNTKEIKKLLKYELSVKNMIKVAIITHIEFIKEEDDEIINNEVCIRMDASVLFNINRIPKFINNSKKYCDTRVDDFVNNGSGWRLNEILCTDVEINQCNSLSGSCSLIEWNSKDLSRLKKRDKQFKPENNCFFEAVAFHFVKKKNKTAIRKFIDKLTIRIESPVRVCDIKKFERDNSQLNIAINVLHEDDGEIYPCYISKNYSDKQMSVLNLLIYKTKKGGGVINHYCYIENLGKVFRKEYRNERGIKSYKNCYTCLNCFARFSREASLDSHKKMCVRNKPQKISYPTEGTTVQYGASAKECPIPITGYFDFEAMLMKINKCLQCDEKKCVHKTMVLNEQKPTCFALIFIDKNGKVIHKYSYAGEDCVLVFIRHLLDIEFELQKIIKTYVQMVITKENCKDFQKAVKCYLCEKPFVIKNNKVLKVRDHDHFTGAYIGAAHPICNLQRRQTLEIPVFAHNFSGYDSHFLINSMKKRDSRITRIKALPLNTEKFRTITVNSFAFKDTLMFLPSSLSNLVNDLVGDKTCEYKILDKCGLYKSNDEKKRRLLLRKGNYN